jgi:Flp pilus assembly pilin Flp
MQDRVKSTRKQQQGRRGITSMEYALIAAVLGALVIGASNRFGTSLSSAYSTIGAAMTTRASGI